MSRLDADVIVVGAGIAGLAAAYRLKTRGFKPLVIERNAWVGGRMRTDRVDGYRIDAGVTLLGRRYQRMRALSGELGLDKDALPVPFSLAIDSADRSRVYRAGRRDQLLFGSNLSVRQKVALSRLGLDLMRNSARLLHGLANQGSTLDDRNAADYLDGFGRGGSELFEQVLEPGLRAAMGGDVAGTSRQVLLTVIFNTLDSGFWNFREAVDVLPRAIARTLDVRLSTLAVAAELDHGNVVVEVERAGGRRTLPARGVILAVPGNQVPGIVPWLPDWLSAPLAQTEFSRLSSLHLGLSRVPAAREVGIGFADPASGIGVLELEHRRAPGRCPSGKAMISVYFVDAPGFDSASASDAELRRRAFAVLESRFPDVTDEVDLVHRVSWPTGIARFKTGRVRQMTEIRARLAQWNQPVEIAGDWLDGVASESALRTGEQAADRLAARLG